MKKIATQHILCLLAREGYLMLLLLADLLVAWDLGVFVMHCMFMWKVALPCGSLHPNLG